MTTYALSPSPDPSVISLDSNELVSNPSSPTMQCTDEQFTQNMAKILDQAKEKISLPESLSTIPSASPGPFVDDLKVNTNPCSTAPTSSNSSSSDEDFEDYEIDTRYNDVDADLTLISADGVGFKIQSLYLRAASKILNERYLAHKITSPVILDLDDPVVERSSVVRLLLDFIHGDFPEPSYEILGIFRQAILLAKKYECKLVLMAMKHFARSSINPRQFDCRFTFILGASLDDISICSEAIANMAQNHRGIPQGWYEEGKEDNNEYVLNEDRKEMAGEYAMDPTTWWVQDFEHVPARYLAALLRAHRLLEDEAKDWNDVAEKFKQLLTPPEKIEGKDGQNIKKEKTK